MSVFCSGFFRNPYLKSPTNYCRVKYEAGVKAVSASDIATDIQFAWHGTPSHQGLIGITKCNLKPSRRSGQAYGPGEYFSTSDTISNRYADDGNGFLIVCALLKNAPYSSKSPHLVVNNPTDGNTMYCIPLGVVLQSQQVAKGNPFAKGYVA